MTEIEGKELPHTDHTLVENKSKNRYKNIYPCEFKYIIQRTWLFLKLQLRYDLDIISDLDI